ncbi:MAG: hypothetical protein JJV99_05295 [Colwellia sp.]|nr:hypothetical protein [Colwellia sp.]
MSDGSAEKAKEEVRIMFIDAGIHRRWHFTKYGYYKLYGENRYWLAFFTQVIASIIFVLAVLNLIFIVKNQDTSQQSILFAMLALASALQTISEFFVGDYKSSGKMLIGAIIFTYIYFNFF